jgi:hypothetical protein
VVGMNRALPTEAELLQALWQGGAPVESVWDWVTGTTPLRPFPC